MDMNAAVVWLRPEYEGREDELVNLSEGADLVGVTRSAVSNWAARHRDFPRLVLVAGARGKRSKYVVRDELVDFARQQLNKPATRAGRKAAPTRPTAVIRASQAEHWTRQVERLTELHTRRAAALAKTTTELEAARRNLTKARGGLTAEINAAHRIDTTTQQRSTT